MMQRKFMQRKFIDRSAARAPEPLCAEAGTRATAPFPAPLSPLAASFLHCAPDRFLLTKPNTSCTIEMPASLRSDGVRDHPGMPFGIIPDSAFGFAGIPTRFNGSETEDLFGMIIMNLAIGTRCATRRSSGRPNPKIPPL